MGGFATILSLLRGLLGTLVAPPVQGIAGWFLAGVFIWSGLAKLRRPTLAAMAMVDFGVTRQVHPPLGFALGVGEAVLAIALALGVLPRLTLLLTAGLLWLFVLLIARSLWVGERFACFCFGESDGELSRWTLARTTALALFVSAAACAASPMAIRIGWHPGEGLQALVALALLGTLALGWTIPRLWRWNSGPLVMDAPQQMEVTR